MKRLLTVVSLFIALPLCAQTPEATLVLRNGKVVTADAAFTIQESIAVADDVIVYVGNDYGVEEFIGPNTRVIDLDGKWAFYWQA